MNNFSYADIIIDRQKFRRAGTKGGGDFNLFDNPTSKFFKIFFYFGNGDSSGNIGLSDSGGLLSPTWLLGNLMTSNAYTYNSAYSYLILNDELQRAILLQNFVELLSNISSESPWYFNSIEGLDAAIERKVATERDFKFDEQRQKISIKCLPDSYDDRIGTLLDLYRSIVWSWAHKREVLPANLRKFDMGILIFNDPTIPFHHYIDEGEKFADINVNFNYRPSYKYIEFHNCEIDYNSSKAGVAGLNNSTGTIPGYTIDIFFDDLYEYRYNEFSMKSMGDMLIIDQMIYSINNQLSEMTGENENYLLYESMQNDLMNKLINYFEINNSDSYEESIIGSVHIGSDDLTDKKLGEAEDKSAQETTANATVKKKLGEVKHIQETTDNATVKKKLGEVEDKMVDSDLPKRTKNSSSNKFAKNAVEQLFGTATNIVEGVVKRAVMGNLYTFSLTKLRDQVQGLLDGNVWSAARGVAEYVRDSRHRKKSIYADGPMRNINYEDSQLSRGTQYTETAIGNQSVDEIKSVETQYNTPVQNNMNEGNPPRTKYVNRVLGNLFSSSTIANNI